MKMWLLPLGEVAERLPKQGLLLDMGCGFGYVANYLSLDSPHRMVVANDPAAPRIAAARRTVGSRRNIEFHAADLREIDQADFDGASVFDVLHHVPYDEQQSLIDELYRRLKPGAVLIIRETDQRPALRYYVCSCVLETLLYAGQEKTRYRPMRSWSEMLQRAGFRIEQVTRNEWWYPSMTCLFVCRKPFST
jgi:2-polyprenyl-3-methyl-5-hydroxy-6-metoxy-1,4-benzoquinol methylase